MAFSYCKVGSLRPSTDPNSFVDQIGITVKSYKGLFGKLGGQLA